MRSTRAHVSGNTMGQPPRSGSHGQTPRAGTVAMDLQSIPGDGEIERSAVAIPCDTVYTTRTKIEAANPKLLAIAAKDAFKLDAVPDVIGGVISFMTGTTRVMIQRGTVT